MSTSARTGGTPISWWRSAGTEKEARESLAALEHAQGYLRHELATRLSLRRVPELRFQQDKNPDVESRIDFLLRRAKKSRRSGEN